ncbi:hypothetical protein CAEBREN_22294 [Caenorhabditis brenneri]|uniref:Uncharacterized protein n=1 Tax=Caenorhabditis brenneri TaxID=135651 RepID=G0NIH3_CAEBE|nr:hypothetical protein CAEBREN_22294 [Caenorhabditis brenneri]
MRTTSLLKWFLLLVMLGRLYLPPATNTLIKSTIDSNEAEIAAYIDKHVTARMPGANETELKELVQQFQVHQICLRTTIYNKQDVGKTRLYDVMRTPEELYINDYSPPILLGWKGNVDLQFVGSNKEIVNYVTAYSTKGEVAKKLDELKQQNRCITRSKAVFKLRIDELNSRHVGALEMVDELLGIPWFGFDNAEVWMTTVI